MTNAFTGAVSITTNTTGSDGYALESMDGTTALDCRGNHQSVET